MSWFSFISTIAARPRFTASILHWKPTSSTRTKSGNLAVVAVLLQEGEPNPAVATTWSNIPAAKEKAVSPEAVDIHAIQLLPANHRYYTYAGSLTTPPCTENVTWLVMVDPMTVSKQQIEKFARLYPNDERPVQPLYGRVVLESK